MIETKTTWEDSGYDCDHCGGEILKRTDHESGQPKRICYQCQACSCQWSLNGDVLRIGSGRHCRVAQEVRMSEATEPLLSSRRIFIILGVAALLVVLRFGGLAVLRLLIPLAIVAFVIVSVVRFGREQTWW